MNMMMFKVHSVGILRPAHEVERNRLYITDQPGLWFLQKYGILQRMDNQMFGIQVINPMMNVGIRLSTIRQMLMSVAQDNFIHQIPSLH